MPERDYKKIEIEKQDMKISLIFPIKAEKEEAEIRRDVNTILSGTLREQMRQRIY